MSVCSDSHVEFTACLLLTMCTQVSALAAGEEPQNSVSKDSFSSEKKQLVLGFAGGSSV